MKEEGIVFSDKHALVPKTELKKLGKKLESELIEIEESMKRGYETKYAPLTLPLDYSTLENVKEVIAEKKKLAPDYLIVIGIGGSNLGTMAVQEAILGKMYNLLEPETKVLYADTVDTESIRDIKKIIEPQLRQGKKVMINVISKGGNTTETIANFEVLLEPLIRFKKNYEKYVIATTNEDSKLWKLSKEKGFTTLAIPQKVGGKYSVFSPVGLFPLGILNIDLDFLFLGASTALKHGLKRNIYENPAMLSAAIQYYHYKKGKNISDLFLFSNNLEGVGKWYRQLMAESLGKRYSLKKKEIRVGMTPTVSIGSTDLHSVAQLYLGGPFDKLMTLVGIEKSSERITVPNLPDYNQLVEDINGRSLDEIMSAILQGVKIAFSKEKKPFIDITLPDKSERSIGEFMQFKMLEVMYLASLLDVNPFDQPNVEDYKKETRAVLKKG